MAKHKGRLELTWADKDKTLLSTGDGRYDYTFVDPADFRVSEVRLLHEVERIDAPTPEDRPADLPVPTSDNLLITGDAMHVLDALAKIPEYSSKYLGKVKLVYIDPPFNTGQAFVNYEDNIEHSIWLTMLRDRLRQIKPLLAPDGVVWVHLDHVESHRCRVVLDEEFGPENFVGEVAWQKTTSPRNDTNRISVSLDPILVYRRTEKFRPNRVARREQSNTSRYKSRDGDPVPWRDGDATAAGARSNDETSIYAIQHPITGGLMYPPMGRHWAMNQEWMLQQLSEWAPYELRDIGDEAKRASLRRLPPDKARSGVKAIMLSVPVDEAAERAKETHADRVWPDLVFLNLDKERMQRKKHLVDDGRVPETLWPHSEVGGSTRAKNQIRDLLPDVPVFATPKPEELIQRIIHVSTQPGDIVLDCFVGSGTTAAVAHKMGRRWVAAELTSASTDVYAKPRLVKVVRGEDLGGVTFRTARVAAEGVTLPSGVTPTAAAEFQTILKKMLDTNAADDQSDEASEDSETLPLVLDDSAVRAVKDALLAQTKTRVERTQIWHGGGGFTHLKVGPSMFESMGDMVLLADWATQGELTKAMCAQLSVVHAPDGIFAARLGKVRYVILDGMVRPSTIDSILDQLPEGETVDIWATQVDEDAFEALRKSRPGSRLEVIPSSVLDSYRRKKATRSPFTPASIDPSTTADTKDDRGDD